MPKYLLTIKSHIDAPDYEEEVIAEDKSQAVEKLFASLRAEYSKEFIDKNTVEV